MTREEVLEELNSLGASISGETLRRWVNAGIVPAPERGNKGRGGGRWSDYPKYTPWEAYAAYMLLKDNSLKRVAEMRKYALHIISDIAICDLYELAKQADEEREFDGLQGERGEVESGIYFYPKLIENAYVDSSVYEWLLLRFRAEKKIGIDSLQGINVFITCNLEHYISNDRENENGREKILQRRRGKGNIGGVRRRTL